MADNPLSAALRRVEQALSTARRRFQLAMQGRRGRQLASRALARLQTLPGPPIYPLRWTSARQRRAFFATNGFGGGIPHRRKGTIAGAWRAEFLPTPEGGLLVLSNPHDAAQYIYGPRTQGFHRDTGWVQVEDVATDFFREAEAAALEVWYAAADPLERLS